MVSGGVLSMWGPSAELAGVVPNVTLQKRVAILTNVHVQASSIFIHHVPRLRPRVAFFQTMTLAAFRSINNWYMEDLAAFRSLKQFAYRSRRSVAWWTSREQRQDVQV